IQVNTLEVETCLLEWARGGAIPAGGRRGALAADLGRRGSLRRGTGSESRELGLRVPAPERHRRPPPRARAPALDRRRARSDEADAGAECADPGWVRPRGD